MTQEVALIPKENESVVNGGLLKIIQERVPKLRNANTAACTAMAEIKVVNDDNIESVKETMVNCRESYDRMVAYRKSMTDELDRLREWLMSFEKPLNTDAKANSEYNRVRKLIAAYEQEKIESNRKAEEEAKKKKLAEQAIVDASAAIKLNITDVIMARCKALESGSKDFFDAVKDMTEFEAKATQYAGSKWRMKQEEYDKCFAISKPSILSDEQFKEFISQMKQGAPYDSINAMFLEKATPILNAWKAKIPQLREEFKAIFAAKDEEQRKKLEDEKKQKDDQDTIRAQENLKQQENTMKATVQSEQMVNNVEADFKEQAIVQGLDKTAPKKKVIKFKNDKPAAELAKMIYHIFMSDKFKGIYKMKDGQKVLDDRGRPVYIDWVDSIVSFFAQYCDAEVPDVIVTEDAKVVIRK